MPLRGFAQQVFLSLASMCCCAAATTVDSGNGMLPATEKLPPVMFCVVGWVCGLQVAN